MKIIFNDVWKELIGLWTKAPRYLAIAYFSCDEDLTFSPEDVLVVNASDAAISAGQTDAASLRRAWESGASVFSLSNLHAKLFVLGNTVAVGSSNSSRMSRRNLVECLGTSDDPHAVAEGIEYIRSLRDISDPVNDKFLKRIEKIPVHQDQGPSKRRPKCTINKSRCWVVGVQDKEFPGDEGEIKEVSNQLEKNAENEGELDWFWWPSYDYSKGFAKEAKPGDLVVLISSPKYRGNTDDTVVYKHARIAEVTRRPGGVMANAYHAVWPDDSKKPSISWEKFDSLIKRTGWKNNKPLKKNSCLEIPDEISRLLAQLWPSE